MASTSQLKMSRQQLGGWLLLLTALVIGILTAGWGTFADEGDNLVIGDMLLRGGVLYRDLFSHHFPFAYYWVAATIPLAGKSIYSLRVLVWIFEIACFATAMWATRWHLALGLAACLWSLVGVFFYNTHVVYYVFGAATMLVVTSITLAVLYDRVRLTWPLAAIIGACGIIALLSNPLLAYGFGIALLFLASKDWRKTLGSAALAGAGLLLYAGFLMFAGDWPIFWQRAIVFNSEIYSKYIGPYAKPVRFSMLLDMMTGGLGILEPEWRNLNPLAPVLDYYQFERWFYTGLFYRIALLGAVVLFAGQRRWRAAAFLYLAAAAALLVGGIGGRIQYFALLALFAIAALITQAWWPWHGRPQKIAAAAVSVLVAVMALWPAARAANAMYDHRAELVTMSQFDGVKAQADQIRAAVCGQTDVDLAWYPDGTYRAWFSGLRPLGGYSIMWPWVAEEGLPVVMPLLADPATKALVVVEDYTVWDQYDTKEYLKPLLDYVKANYADLGNGWYLSPAAAAGCPQPKPGG